MRLTDIIFDVTRSKAVTAVLLSYLPLFELKGGILYARGAGLGFLNALVYGVFGSAFIFFTVWAFAEPCGFLFKKITGIKGSGFLSGRKLPYAERGEKALISGVFSFVALPLPLTGVWTGTFLAYVSGLKLKESFFAVMLGNLLCAVIISALAEACIAYTDLILSAFTVVVAVLLAIKALKAVFTKTG